MNLCNPSYKVPSRPVIREVILREANEVKQMVFFDLCATTNFGDNVKDQRVQESFVLC